MPAITQSKTRYIVKDFAEEIRRRKVMTAKPSKGVINFRNEMANNFERDIVQVPICLLRFRKDNGRIASDLLDYENTYGVLVETDDQAQGQLREFLRKKDPEKTAILKKNILHAGQREPAIITCDGFLIDGNRRKMVMDRLRDDFPEDKKFEYTDVVSNMRNYAARINSQTIQYWPTGRNSNSYAFSYVESLGFDRPTPGLSAPGWDVGL